MPNTDSFFGSIIESRRDMDQIKKKIEAKSRAYARKINNTLDKDSELLDVVNGDSVSYPQSIKWKHLDVTYTPIPPQVYKTLIMKMYTLAEVKRMVINKVLFIIDDWLWEDEDATARTGVYRADNHYYLVTIKEKNCSQNGKEKA